MRSVNFIGATFVTLLTAGALGEPAQPNDSALPAGFSAQKTIYGEALADPRGMTLYVSDQDGASGKSKCIGACAETWTPLAAPRIGRASGDWSIATREDGTKQWVYKGKPLYVYAGDHAPGDVNGDGASGSWHAVLTNRAFLPAGIAIRPTDYGPTFVSADGRTLYMEIKFFYNAGANGTPRHQDSPPPSACSDDCARTWTPLSAPADAAAAGDWSPIKRDDGTLQWAWKGHPLYTYAQDAKPGETLGEGHWIFIGNVGTHWEVANIVL